MEPTATKHQKHAKLFRPDYGAFHRVEWALLGAPCPLIKQLSQNLMGALADQYTFGYVDADHGQAEAEPDSPMEGAQWQYTDKIGFHRFDQRHAPTPFARRERTLHLDAVLINGNHFRGKQQIVIVHPQKEDSLRRKLDRLTDIQLVLLSEGVSSIFPFLKDKLAEQQEVPILRLEDTSSVVEWFAKQMRQTRPPLFGLVLAGGKSQRMGKDKGLIDYHGKPQREHAAALLAPSCEQVFYSFRPDQTEQAEAEATIIRDTFAGLGPFGGILSAFRAHPEVAWLTLATDLPLLDETSIAQLAAKRNPSKFATAFHNPKTDFPEPLVTIWEPRSYPVLLRFLAQGYSCPRKVLINTDVELIEAADPEALFNVNKPEEAQHVLQVLAKRQ